MKRTILAGILLAAALPLFAQSAGNDWQQFDLFGGIPYSGTGSSLRCTNDDLAVRVSGTASAVKEKGGGGYVIESKADLEFSGRRQLKIRVSGINTADTYDMQKLLKLEVNGTPLSTTTPRMLNGNDLTYINARNGEAEFDLSKARNSRNIRKIELVFFNCTMTDVTIEVFYR